MRTILHSDLNNFYATVECQRHPEYEGRPLAVVGRSEERHGIVLAKNYLAKDRGIKTGMVIWQAKQLCHDLVTVVADFDEYLRCSLAVRKIYASYTDMVESYGIDECWLDVTGSSLLFGTGEQIAVHIKQQIKDKLGLTVSIGVSWNKIFAKLGSEIKKPDAVTVIDKNNYREIVWKLPVENLLFVGKATTGKLNRINIMTIGDLAQVDRKLLERILGKWGGYLSSYARGEDCTPVAKFTDTPTIKSVGNSLTNYRDMECDEDVKILFFLLAESVVSRCMELGIKGVKTLQIWVRDNRLMSIVRQGQLPQETLLSGELTRFAMNLFCKAYTWQVPVRSLGLSVSGFSYGIKQLSVFYNEIQYGKSLQLEMTIKKIRAKYGHNKIMRAVVLKDKKLTQKDIQSENTIHPESFFRF